MKRIVLIQITLTILLHFSILNAQNNPPVLGNLINRTISENSYLSFVVSATDPDGQTPALTAFNVPAHGLLDDYGNGTGLFTFLPDYTQAGVYNVGFIASDGALTDTGYVQITVIQVNLPPVLSTILPQSVPEGGHLEVMVTSSDFDLDPLILTAENMPLNSAFDDSGNGHGLFTFNPAFNQEGIYYVRFIVSDGALADSQLVSISVGGTNQPPVGDPIADQFVNEKSSLLFTVHFVDPDGQLLALSAFNLPAHSTFHDNGNGNGQFNFLPDSTQAGSYQPGFLAFDGSLADTVFANITVNDINVAPILDPIQTPQVAVEGQHLEFAVSASDFDNNAIVLTTSALPANAVFADSGNGTGLFIFNPDYVQSGSYDIWFYVADTSLADSQLVRINVVEQNLPPVLTDVAPQTVDEDAHLEFVIMASDPDGQALALTAINVPTNAALFDSGNGHGLFTFNPDYSQSGVYQVRFIASDGNLADTITVGITVNHINLAPILNPIGSRTVPEGSHLGFTVTSSDYDLDVLTLLVENLPANAAFTDSGNGHGLFTFDPDYSQGGDHIVRFIVSDANLADTEIVTITVNDVGFPPVLNPIGARTVTEGETLAINISASDPDLTIPILQALNRPLNSTFTDSLNGHGQFIFIPDFTQVGVDTVLFIASDGALADSEYVEITILVYGNVPPVLDPIGDQFVDEGDTLDVAITAYDLDGTIPGIYTDNLPPNAVLTDFHDGTAQLYFYPNYYQSGSYNVLIFAYDGEFADSEYIEITVNEINGPPELTNIGSQIVNEGDSLGIALSAVDPDNDAISFGLANIPDNAYLVDYGNGTGLFYFLPGFTQAGQYNITIYASDGVRADSQAVMITVVEGGNQAPQFEPIDTLQYVIEGDSLGLIITAHDPDGDMLVFAFDNLPPNSDQMALGPDSVLFYFTPDYNQIGIDTVTVHVNDGQLSSSLDIYIEVLEAGDLPPIFDPVDPRFIPEGDTLNLTVTAVDLDGIIPPIITINNQQPHSTFNDNHDGTATYNYIPDYYDAGIDTVVFIAIDEDDLQDILAVEITTLEFNIAPILTYDGDSVAVQGETLEAELIATDSTDGDSGPIYLSALYLPVNSDFDDNGDHTGTFTFTPDFNQSGIDSAIFIAVDAGTPPLSRTIIVHLEIRSQNRPPIWDPIDAYQIDQAETLYVPLSATDPDGDQVFFRLTTSPRPPRNSHIINNGNGTGELYFAPDYTQSGIFLICIEAHDLLDGSLNQAFIFVNDLGNQTPTLNFIEDMSLVEGETLQVSITATDPDSTPPVLTVESTPNRFNFNDNGNGTADIYFEPLFNQSGDYNLLFKATDPEGAIDSQYVLLTVIEWGNQPPRIGVINPGTLAEGESISMRVLADDPDSTTPYLSVEDLPRNAAFIDSGNGVGRFNFSPDFLQVFQDSTIFTIVVVATDYEDSSIIMTRSTTVTVRNVNQAPTIDPLGPFTINEGDSLGFLVTAFDPDTTYPLLRQGGTPLPNSSFHDSGNGVGYFSFEPDYSQAGVKSFPFWAKDIQDTTVAVYTPVSITVLNTNRPPVLTPLPADTSIQDGIPFVLNLSATDPDLDSLTFFAHNLPPHSSLINHYDGTGTFTFTPGFGDLGEYFVTFGASDGQNPALVDTQIVRIEVISTGLHPPQFQPIESYYAIPPDSTLNITMVATDLDGGLIVISYLDSLPDGAVFVDGGNGVASFSWRPDSVDAGIHGINFKATDETDLFSVLAIEIEVVTWIRGDANGDRNLTGPDVTYLVQYFNGVNPRPQFTGQGDANGDGQITGPDVTYLVNYFRGSGPPPPP